MTTIQDVVDQAVARVEHIGHQWKQSNAHGHAITVCIGSIVTGEEVQMPLNEEQIKRLEAAGTVALFTKMSMMTYSAIVEFYMPTAMELGLEEDEDD